MNCDEILLGLRTGTGKPLRFGSSEVLKHTLILGKSGSGKTMQAIAMALQILALSCANITVLDLKGETCDVIRQLLLELDRRSVLPRDILAFSFSRGAFLPLDPLVPIHGMEPAVQASIVVDLLSGLSDGFGPRMVNIARSLVAAVMAARGSLLDVRALLVDERVAPWLATRVADPELRQYLSLVFPNEPAASKDSLRARLDNLLALPAVRAMLCCGRSTPAAAFLSSPLALIDLGGAGMGSKAIATFIGSWIFTLLASAIYGRDSRTKPRHSWVLIDEWQRLAAHMADEIEDILATARSNRVSLTLCNQYAGQISAVSPALWEGVRTNVALEILFRPEPADLQHLGHVLPVTGRMVDPARPDRLLSAADEQRRLIRDLSNLRPREALVVSHLSGEPACVVQTPTLPLAAAQSAWNALSCDEQARWTFGASATPADTLIPRRLPVPATIPNTPKALPAVLPTLRIPARPERVAEPLTIEAEPRESQPEPPPRPRAPSPRIRPRRLP